MINFLVDDNEQKIRITICSTCESYDRGFMRCKKCGCFMPIKTRLLNVACHFDHWNNPQLREHAQKEIDENSGN